MGLQDSGKTLSGDMNEADTCRQLIVPKLREAGWGKAPYSIAEQRTFSNPKGRIRIIGGQKVRGKPKRADYLLRYRRDFPIAVVEAKADYKAAGTGLAQAKEYAEILDLKFAYSTNGTGVVEFDFTTGTEQNIDAFPAPEELWSRLHAKEPSSVANTQLCYVHRGCVAVSADSYKEVLRD